jgi:quercetin dioxygenase-like cupin family protein
MRITRSSDIASTPMEAEHFSGPATRQDFGRVEQPALSPLVVSFEAGARTSWHRHGDGQILFVLDGRGRVAARDAGEAEIGPGDCVYAPAGEEHWHGAAEGASMRHIALSFGETEWLEPVEGS